MARVRSISNHPYAGRMRVKGIEYDADASDVDLLVSLGRVVPVPEDIDGRVYSTREMHAGTPNIRPRRRVPTNERSIPEDSAPADGS
jgi:hypothetical protein